LFLISSFLYHIVQISIFASNDDLRSETSELEPSLALNTSAFNTATHATTRDLLDTETAGDLIKIKGKTYISVDRTANLRVGYIPSWIWSHSRELRLLAGKSL
jgi:hypothetical protein